MDLKQTIIRAAVAAAVVSVLGACATSRQPEIRAAGIQPALLSPGDTAVISVEIQDKFDIVERVEGVVKEDTTITFQLMDDGVPPDVEANDGIWTLQVDVPFNAPPGAFELDLKAYNSKGQVIVIRDENGEAQPLAAQFGLEIRYPQAEAAAPPTEP